MGILLELFGDSVGILRGCMVGYSLGIFLGFWDSLTILSEFFGNYLEILSEFFGDVWFGDVLIMSDEEVRFDLMTWQEKRSLEAWSLSAHA